MNITKPINDFIKRFEANLKLDTELILKKQNRYFLINETLKPQLRKDFFYVGAYLGKIKRRIFFPSFILLSMIAEGQANKTVVNEKTAWLFICGRDVFKQGIKQMIGLKNKGHYTLVMNQNDQCLGFGKILCTIERATDETKVIVKNISNIGDFLKREK